MRGLRNLTTLFVILGLAILGSYPVSVGSAPKESAPRYEKRAYAVRLMSFVSVSAIVWFCAGLSAFLYGRKIRREYEEQVTRNLTDLIAAPIKEKPKDEPTQ